MELIDTHCHIQEIAGEGGIAEKWHKAGVNDIDKVIDEAHDVGVKRFILVGTTLADSELAVEVSATRQRCWPAVGIHPHEAKDHLDEKSLSELTKLAHSPKVLAIGECGLDYFYEYSSREAQIELLKFQIELALGANLPLAFHVREAFDDFWPIFESYRGIRGVLHSFTDSQKNLERALSHNLYIGVNGIATFTKNEAQLVTFRTIPQQSLLLETDAPFLTPAPERGKICTPKHVSVTAKFLAELRGEPVEQLAKATTGNARKLFGL